MPTDHAELMERWNATLPDQPALGADLIDRYSEPHRRYHTTDHLRHVLIMIDELADDSHDTFLVRLAAWFHDAVYAIPPGQVGNEEASARLSLRELVRTGLEQEDLTQVARLVRLTETHLPGPRDPEGELLCDADLAILAAEPAAYARYVEQIRDEYAVVPEERFLAGRLAVLTELAGRDVFRTSKGRRLTAAARRNLEAEMVTLIDRSEWKDRARDRGDDEAIWSPHRPARRLVADGRGLPDLPALLRRQQRRRDRRPPRHHEPAGLPGRAGGGRGLAVAGLHLADGRQRLRHQRLPGRRPAVRHPGRAGRPDRRTARARHEDHHGPGGQPHLRRAPLVRRVPRPGLAEARLVLVAARPDGVRTRHRGRRTDQLGLYLLRLGVDLRRPQRRVLPARVLAQAARPQLGEPRGAGGGLRDDALVGRPRRRRLPDGRDQHDLQGPGAEGRRTGRRAGGTPTASSS